MIWEELGKNEDGQMVYQRVDADGKVRLTAVKGYPELDAYLAWVEAGNNPEDFWERDELLTGSGEDGITVDIEEL